MSRMQSVSSSEGMLTLIAPDPTHSMRPMTLAAWQVRAQLSMLFVPRHARVNFCMTKLASLPAPRDEPVSMTASGPLSPMMARRRLAMKSSASSQVTRSSGAPLVRRIIGW